MFNACGAGGGMLVPALWLWKRRHGCARVIFGDPKHLQHGSHVSVCRRTWCIDGVEVSIAEYCGLMLDAFHLTPRAVWFKCAALQSCAAFVGIFWGISRIKGTG